MNFPEHLNYTSDHEWLETGGEAVTVGVTDYAQDALGDVVYVGLPQVGREVAAGESIAEIESTKSVSDVYAPLTGTVTEVNEALNDRPELINEDPYGEGWICKITGAVDTASLLDQQGYRALIQQG